MKSITYHPIGIIHSNYKKKEGMPIQGSLSKNSKGRIEIFTKYQEGLKELEGFSHIIIIYHFHLSKGFSLLTMPFLEDIEHGIFACRAPKRPNPIGISIAKLEKVVGNIIYISECDIIDGTPLLDIKPYVSKFDIRSNVRDGWMQRKLKHAKEFKSDNRYS